MGGPARFFSRRATEIGWPSSKSVPGSTQHEVEDPGSRRNYCDRRCLESTGCGNTTFHRFTGGLLQKRQDAALCVEQGGRWGSSASRASVIR